MSSFKTKSRRVSFFARLSTSRLRRLPDFIIIGAQKSGTTSLFNYLSRHPQVIPSFTKEVHYFDGGKDPGIDTYARGSGWYRAHFPIKTMSGRYTLTGEASPLYIFNPAVPQRIFRLLPQVKLIALLRNPVERAVSHYYHERRKGREPLSILEAFDSEAKRIQTALQEKDYKNLNFINFTYLKRGLYAEQLERYFNFFDKNQILIIKSENFFTNPGRAMIPVCRFLGIDHNFSFTDLKPRNTGKNKKPVAPEVRKYLEDYYSDQNQRLFSLLGNNLGWE